MKNIRCLIVFFLFFCPLILLGQQTTNVKGTVVDSLSGKPLSFVSVTFKDRKSGTITDGGGEFDLRYKGEANTVVFSQTGYQSKYITIRKGESNILRIFLNRENSIAEEEKLTSQVSGATEEQDSIAVDLTRKVIAGKNQNRVENNDYYQFEQYEKMTLSVSELDTALQNQKAFDKIKFIFNYIDTSDVGNNQILIFSVREVLSDEYRRRSPRSRKSLINAIRQDGMAKKIDSERVNALLNEGIKQVNVFDNEINLLFRRFVSPLSSFRAFSFYKYHIADTVDYEGHKCINLIFVPKNSRDMSFFGNFLISADSTYSVRKVVLKTPRDINLNFISGMTITQEFEELDNGQLAKTKESSSVEFSLFKVHYGIHADNERIFTNYLINKESPTSFGRNDEMIFAPYAESRPDSMWEGYRHVPLKTGELKVGGLLAELEKLPYYNTYSQLVQILLTNYAHTGNSRQTSKFDFGPVWSTVSRNDIEGIRFRVGGRSTANFNRNLFINGYGAYGTKSKKIMYSGMLIYSFNKKMYHENEYPKKDVGFVFQYDIHTPGQRYYYADPDNIFLSFKRGKADKMTYVRKGEIWNEKEFTSGFYYKLWSRAWNEAAAGSLQFEKKNAQGDIYAIQSYNASEVGLLLRFAMNEKFSQGRDSRMILKRDGPVFALSQSLGLKDFMGGQYGYYFTELSVQKQLWLSGYGHLNIIAKGGKLWGSVPYPLLILPNANQTYTILPESYSMMNTLEFISDSYTSLDLTYNMDGWLFNRIAPVRKFKLREVVAFKGLMGWLRKENNPENNPKLFLFPEDSYVMSQTPYMEVSFGIANILKILRVDYVRRLTYLDHADIDKNGVRVTLNLTF